MSIAMKEHFARLFVLAALAVLVIGPAVRADGTVRFYYFYQTGCEACEVVHSEVVEPLLEAYGDRVAIEERDIDEPENLELLLSLEERFQAESVSIPEVFIGNDALIGPQAISEHLEERVEHYAALGGVELPLGAGVVIGSSTPVVICPECTVIHSAQRTAVASKATPSATPQAMASPGGSDSPAIHAAYFGQFGCDSCDRAEIDLQYVVQKYPQLKVQHFDITQDAALNEYLSQQANVPTEKHLTAPSLFVADSYLLGDDIRAANIERLIQPYLATGAAEPWAGWEASQSQAEQTILDRFRSLGLWTVVGAGLLDGINPCAFATMIFLISYLSVRKRQGSALLATGAAFTAGVSIAYLGLGLGLVRFLTALPILNTIGRWLNGLTLVLCVALAWGSFSDFRKARQGRLKDISLKLPDRLRGWIRHLIREGSQANNYIPASLLVGFAVSIVELACTGQVYLPTIVFVLGLPEWRARAALALVVYNVMFVVPLVVVFLVAYLGTTSQQLTQWMTRNAAGVKLATGVLFLLMAGWLGYSLLAL
jgi:cytochrome c biogenesis protein CcdA/thiol-disulfide isomerase/thioredoxin